MNSRCPRMEVYGFYFVTCLLMVFNTILLLRCDACAGVNFVSRQEWNAKQVKPDRKIPAVTHVFIHHTTGGQCSSIPACSIKLLGFQKDHIDKKWGDIGYSFLIGGDGKVYVGRGWNIEGAHTIGYNRNGIGISFIGDFTKEAPASSMLNAAKALIACGVKEGKIIKNYQLHGHRDAYNTACPGEKLYKEIKSWKNYRKI